MAIKAKKVTNKKKKKVLTKEEAQKRAATRAEIGLALRTLISNDACVQERSRPWWAAVAVAVVSLAISLAPTMKTYFTIQGSRILESPNYGLELSLVRFDDVLKASNATATIKEGSLSFKIGEFDGYNAWKELTVDDVGEAIFYNQSNTKNTYPAYTHSRTETNYHWNGSENPELISEVTTKVDFAVYYQPYDYSGSVSDFYNTIVTVSATNWDPNGSQTAYTCSCLVLSNEGFVFHKVNSNATIIGSWNDERFNDMSLLLDIQDDMTLEEREFVAVEAWKKVNKIGYDKTRIKNGWIYTGIHAGINAGAMLLFGLLVFLMSRGKTNPMRVINLWEAQKIAYWASFTPAVLSLLAFIPYLSSMLMIIFVIIYGFRIMWMSMRSLRPTYQ